MAHVAALPLNEEFHIATLPSALQQGTGFSLNFQWKWRSRDGLLGKCDNVTLQPCGVRLFAVALVNLMEVAAHAKENPTRTGGG